MKPGPKPVTDPVLLAARAEAKRIKKAAIYAANPSKYIQAAVRSKKRIESEDSILWNIKNTCRRFKITPDLYFDMAFRQNDKCKICRGRGARRLAVDHCHVTGIIRGLLCSRCNVALGQFSDNPDVLLAAAAYLKLYR